MIKHYPRYKESGVDWLREIPNHWEFKRAKYIFDEVKEFSEDGSETLLSVSEYYGIAPRETVIEEGDYISRANTLIGYKKCNKNDLIINIMLAWKRGLGVTDWDGIVSPAYCVFRNNLGIGNPKYLHYLLRTDIYISEFKRNSTGVIDSRLRLYPDEFMRIFVILPPLSEQRQIAGYLDYKTRQIDIVIEKKQKLIDLLKEKRTTIINEAVCKGIDLNIPMKNSNNKVIVSIPKHWKIIKFNYIAKKISVGFVGPIEKYYTNKNGVMLLKTGNIGLNKIIIDNISYVTKEFHEINVKSQLFPGNIIIARHGESGKAAVIPETITEANCLNVVILRKSNLMNEYFYSYLLNADRYRQYLKSVQGGSVQGVINTRDIMELRVVFPPIKEQDEIVTYINQKIKKIEKHISIIKRQINFLKEYRTALISNVVTGKLDVREEALA